MAEASGSGPTHTQKAILAEFNSKRQRLSDFVRKIEELNAEVAEHDMVIKTLEPMEPTRK
jgi:chaperonin cofactor prefoldin